MPTPAKQKSATERAMEDDINDLKPQSKPTLADIMAEIGGNRKELDRIVAGGRYYPGRMSQTQQEAIRLLQAANQSSNPDRWLESLSPYDRANLEFNINNSNMAGYVDKSAPNKAVVQNMQEAFNTVPHELTHTLQMNNRAGVDLSKDNDILERARYLSPEMRNSVFPSANRFDNPLEAWANINSRAHNVAAEGGDFINSPEGRALFPDQAAQRDYYTKAMPGVNSITPDTGTFVPNNESYIDKVKRVMGFADGGMITDTQTPAVEAIKDTVRDPQANEMLNLDLAKLAVMNQPQRMASGGIAHMDRGGVVDMPYDGISLERAPDTNAFSVNRKPASQAYTALGVPLLDESGQVKPNPQTSYDLRMADLNRQLDSGIKPDRMSDIDFAQDQVSRGRGQGHVIKAIGDLFSGVEHLTGSSMGLDPTMGLIGKTGELHAIPGAARYMASRALPEIKDTAAMAAEMYLQGRMPGMVAPASYAAPPTSGGKLLTPVKIAHQTAQRNAALPIEQGGLGLHPENTAQDRLAAQNYYDYLHGTKRLDRLLEGKGLDPKRATSGPMPYGTDKPELASKYATSKADTSMYDEGNMANYFQVNPKDLGIKGKNLITVEQSWHYLLPDQKKKILSGYYRTGYENPKEASGAFTLHPEGSNASIADKRHLDHVLQEERGNPLAALRNLWGESGELYDNPEDLSKIFKVAGYPYEISQTNAPWTAAQGVLTGKVRMDQPLITSDVEHLTNNVIPFLKEQFKNDRTKLKIGADQWAKESHYTPKQWVDELQKDINEGKNSYVWTSIPDKVTNALKQLGHDGIIDVGGKGGGEGHQVVIPFHPKQVRSKFAAFDPMEKESTDLLKAHGGKVSFADSLDAMRHELSKAK